MKRLLILLAVLSLLAPAYSGLAENLYDDEISFGPYSFGMTFAEARKINPFIGITYSHRAITTRMIGDKALSYVSKSTLPLTDYGDPVAFCANSLNLTVAGYAANAQLYFSFPVESKKPVLEEEQAQLYAGIYTIFLLNSDKEKVESIFNDLQQKLTQVYGAPYQETKIPAAIWGPLRTIISDSDKSSHRSYGLRTDELRARYVVWKSSVNGAMIVLRCYKDSEWYTDIVYLYPAGDAIFDQL